MLSSGEQCSGVSLKVGPHSLQWLKVAHINTPSQRCCSVFQTGLQLLRGSMPLCQVPEARPIYFEFGKAGGRKKTPSKNPMSGFGDINKIESIKSWDHIWDLSLCFDKPLGLASTHSFTRDSGKLQHTCSQWSLSDQLYTWVFLTD